MNKLLKIFFDVVISFFALLVFSPLIIIISIISYTIQGLPIFFVHERLGINGRPFKMIKLRTMKNGPSLSAKSDEKRLTEWGRFLRKTSIDEIPVFINVLKGNMSMVGPRPLPIKYLSRFNNTQILRLNVKPGITGLAQINGRNEISWEDRFKLDIKYVNNNSVFIDFKIMILTFIIVFKGIGIKSKESEIMPEFFGDNQSCE